MLRFIVITLLTSCVLCELLHKYEGDKCQWGEASGTCIHIHKCPRAQLYIKEKNHPPICEFNKKNEPIICCTDCDFVEDNRKIIVNPDLGLLHLTGQKSHDKCIRFIEELDYDCKKKKLTDVTTDVTSLDPFKKCRPIWPKMPDYLFSSAEGHQYFAILGYGDVAAADIDGAQWGCAGAIISEKFILTAAQCLNSVYNGPVKFVAVNVTDNYVPMWPKYTVKRSIPHPEYKPGSQYHDIALIETENIISFSRDVLPACLNSNQSFDGGFSYVMSWKPVDEDQLILDRISISNFDEIKCSFFYPPTENLTNGFNDTIQTCYGENVPPRDYCVDDLGAPLLYYFDRIEGCADIVLGVTTIPRTCGMQESSGLFTKVIHYVPWIESIVWP